MNTIKDLITKLKKRLSIAKFNADEENFSDENWVWIGTDEDLFKEN